WRIAVGWRGESARLVVVGRSATIPGAERGSGRAILRDGGRTGTVRQWTDHRYRERGRPGGSAERIRRPAVRDGPAAKGLRRIARTAVAASRGQQSRSAVYATGALLHRRRVRLARQDPPGSAGTLRPHREARA